MHGNKRDPECENVRFMRTNLLSVFEIRSNRIRSVSECIIDSDRAKISHCANSFIVVFGVGGRWRGRVGLGGGTGKRKVLCSFKREHVSMFLRSNFFD